MSLPEPDLISIIPDLRPISLKQLPDLDGDSVLAQAIADYRKRQKESDEPSSSFNAKI